MYQTINDINGRRALLRHPSTENSGLAVFIHGIGQDHLRAWSPLTNFLQTRAALTTPFSSWDYLFFGYDSFRYADFIDLARLLRSELRDAKKGIRFFESRPYRRFTLIGFSLGAILIRQFLVACPNLLGSDAIDLHSVLLFNPPYAGSAFGYAWPFAMLRGVSPRFAFDLQPTSTQLKMLADWTACCHEHHSWPAPAVYAGIYDSVVINASSSIGWPGDLPVQFLAGGHDLHQQLDAQYGRAFQAIRSALM